MHNSVPSIVFIWATAIACEAESPPRSEVAPIEATGPSPAQTDATVAKGATPEEDAPVDHLSSTEEPIDVGEQARFSEAMLRRPGGGPVPILASFEIERAPHRSGPEPRLAVTRPGPVVETADSPVYIKSILRVESLPFHGPIAAAQVELFDGRSGWVESPYILLSARVVEVAEDDTLNIRSGDSWESPVVDEATLGERIFFDPVDRHEAVGMKGCQDEFIQVQTLRGVVGYASCRYIQ